MRLALLWWKDLKWQLDHKAGTAWQLLVPLIVSILFTGGLKITSDYTVGHHRESIVSHETGIVPENYRLPWKIRVFVNTTLGKDYKEVKKFCLWNVTCKRVIVYDKYDRMVKKIDNKTHGLVVIDEWNLEEERMRYRIIDLKWAMERNLAPLWGVWSQDQLNRDQWNIGDNYVHVIQMMVEGYFYAMVQEKLHNRSAANPFLSPSTSLSSPTVVRHRAMPLFNQPFHRVYTVLMHLSTAICILTVWQMASQLKEERDNGAKKLIRSLGVGRFQYFGAFFVNYAIKLFVCQVIFWLGPIFITKNVLNVNVILPGVIIYSCVMSSFSILISTICRTKCFVRLGSVFVLVCLHLGQLHFSDMSASLALALPSSFFFPSAHYYYMRAAATRIMTGGFLSTSLATSLYAIPYLLFDSMLMFLFALYIDTVYPEKGERAQKCTFVFSMDYWRPTIGDPMPESSECLKGIMLSEDSVADVKDVKSRTESLKNWESVPLVRVEGLCWNEGDRYPVSRVNMTANSGEVLVVYGPRGCGGSELLQLIGGQLVPECGTIKLGVPMVENFEASRNTIVSLSSGLQVLSHLTVEDTVDWVTKMRGGRQLDTVLMIEELQLMPHINKKVGSLNATHRQLLSTLLAFVGEPEIVLLDEPTRDCSPAIRNCIHTFIIRRKAKRTIVVYSYDAMETEQIGDSVLFLCNGQMAAAGTVQAIRNKFVQGSSLIVWPAGDFDEKRQGDISNTIKGMTKLESIEVDRTPNESVRFVIPHSCAAAAPKIINELERNQDHLGIKHCDFVWQSVQDAYHNCCHSREKVRADFVDTEPLIAQLPTRYTDERTGLYWPELSVVWRQKLAHWRRRPFTNVASLLLPALALALLALAVSPYRLTEESLTISPSLLSGVFMPKSSILSNIPTVDFGPLQYVHNSNSSIFDNVDWIYTEPPFTTGMIEDTNTTHLFSLRTIRFADVIVNNMYMNMMLKKKDAVQLTLQSVDAPEWRWLIQYLGSKNNYVLQLPTRHVAGIIVQEWLIIVCVSGFLSILLAHAALFPGSLAEHNCIRMQYLMGARPACFWAAIFLLDIAQFLLFLILLSPLLLFLMPSGAIALSCLMTLVAYVNCLPQVYLVSLRLRSRSVPYFLSLFLIGTISLIPAFLPFLSIQYGDRLNWWISFALLVAWVYPPLATTLTSAIGANVLANGLPMGKAIGLIFPLVLANATHLSAWLVFVLTNSERFKRLLVHMSFSKESMVMRPEDLLDAGAASPSEHSAAAPSDPSSAVSKSELRAKGGADSNFSELEEQIRDYCLRAGEPSTDQTGIAGLWAHRDQLGSTEPMIQWKAVAWEHYANGTGVTLSLFESQCLNLFGDMSDTRSKLLDLAAGQSFPGSGAIEINQKKAGVESNISYVPSDIRLNLHLSPRQTLEMAAHLKNFVNSSAVVELVLKITDLSKIADVPLEELGESDRYMVALAVAVVDKPYALLIDQLDMHISPTRMRTVWSIICRLREHCQVPVVFSTPRQWESLSASSHIVMLYKGSITAGDTTLEIKKRYTTLFTLTVSLKRHMTKDSTSKIISGQLGCRSFPHPNPQKLAFFVAIDEGKQLETMTKVRSLLGNIGISEYHLANPDLDVIYNANYTATANR